jgi:regulator of protease activity HflC (stomatin/prohibitin superfamily)
MNTQDIIFILILIAVIGMITGIVLRASYRAQFIVCDGTLALLYHNGKLIDTLNPGLHARWGRSFKLAVIDTRKTQIQVAGQEVLTSDNISVKLSLVLTTQIVDATKSVQAVDSHFNHLYTAAQSAIRFVVAGFTMDALLAERAAIGAQLLELLTAQAESVGVQLHKVDVRDVMLPGELRKAFSEVVKAKQEGLAALERARGESAALRNLANAARLMESQPALATLRFLQTLEAKGTNQNFLMNDLTALIPTLKSRNGNRGS